MWGLEILIAISYVDDTEVFKTCLDYWNMFAADVSGATPCPCPSCFHHHHVHALLVMAMWTWHATAFLADDTACLQCVGPVLGAYHMLHQQRGFLQPLLVCLHCRCLASPARRGCRRWWDSRC